MRKASIYDHSTYQQFHFPQICRFCYSSGEVIDIKFLRNNCPTAMDRKQT